MCDDCDGVECEECGGPQRSEGPVERVVMRVYYMVFERHKSPNEVVKSWLIRRTPNDLDTIDGLKAEIDQLEAEAGCFVWLLGWRRLVA